MPDYVVTISEEAGKRLVDERQALANLRNAYGEDHRAVTWAYSTFATCISSLLTMQGGRLTVAFDFNGFYFDSTMGLQVGMVKRERWDMLGDNSDQYKDDLGFPAPFEWSLHS